MPCLVLHTKFQLSNISVPCFYTLSSCPADIITVLCARRMVTVTDQRSLEGHVEHYGTVVAAHHVLPDHVVTQVVLQPLRQHKVVQPPVIYNEEHNVAEKKT